MTYGLRIFPQHAAMLAASGITPEHADARGYVSIDTKTRLEQLGITRTGRQVPGLLIPSLRVDGSTWGYQYRPDQPRRLSGKPVKYETPMGQRNGIDVPPGVGPQLADPGIPLWITEGAKKADAGAIAGLCVVDLPGVWSWIGKNRLGGKTAVSDWRDIALDGRRVILAFDGDVSAKRAVRAALDSLAAYLTGKGARVDYLHLPNGDDKVGLDDYLADNAVTDLWALVRPEPPALAPSPSPPRSSPDNTATPQHPRSTTAPTIALLRRILDEFAAQVVSRGLVGEQKLAQLLYLVLTSRLLDQQVSAGVKGHSASGKSYTVETVVKFFPAEATLIFTAMSEKALVYSEEEYAHRTLIVYEVVALREGVEDDMTSYFVRSLLSEGRIDYEVAVRDPNGGFTTRKIVKEGPTNLIFTTTQTRVHAENETRILSLSTDDGTEQTMRVLLQLAAENNDHSQMDQWHELQRWLADQDNRVTIPYGYELVRQIPPVAVRLRRDVGALLALIRAHAVLHQATRERDALGRIIATLDDYDVVRGLVAETIAEGVGATVSETVRETVNTVATIASAEGVGLRELADKLGLDKSNVSRRIRRAADGGYVRNLEERRGKPARWVVGDPLPDTYELLPGLTQLRNTPQRSDQGCCGVAPVPAEESEDTSDHWTPERRAQLGRCQTCEWHPPTQGHHPDCPESLTTTEGTT